jgi:hypothetical protein
LSYRWDIGALRRHSVAEPVQGVERLMSVPRRLEQHQSASMS